MRFIRELWRRRLNGVQRNVEVGCLLLYHLHHLIRGKGGPGSNQEEGGEGGTCIRANRTLLASHLPSGRELSELHPSGMSDGMLSWLRAS